MEDKDSACKTVSYKEDDAVRRISSSKNNDLDDDDDDDGRRRRRRLKGCLPFMEISIDPGVKSLKHLDSNKLKDGIKKWAKAVVIYARQVSQHFGSSRKSCDDE